MPSSLVQEPLETIIDKMISRDLQTKEALKAMTYIETILTEQRSANGKATKSQEIKMEVLPGREPNVKIISSRGDHLPTNPDDAQRLAQGKENQFQQMDLPLGDLSKRFTFSLAGLDDVNGENAYVLQFIPKANQPYINQTEKVLNQLRGHLWVSTRDYTILETDAQLSQPVSIAWIFATIRELHFHYKLRPGPTRLGPFTVTTEVKVGVVFATIRQKTRVDREDFKPLNTTENF